MLIDSFFTPSTGDISNLVVGLLLKKKNSCIKDCTDGYLQGKMPELTLTANF
jgi:hypothetical protein